MIFIITRQFILRSSFNCRESNDKTFGIQLIWFYCFCSLKRLLICDIFTSFLTHSFTLLANVCLVKNDKLQNSTASLNWILNNHEHKLWNELPLKWWNDAKCKKKCDRTHEIKLKQRNYSNFSIFLDDISFTIKIVCEGWLTIHIFFIEFRISFSTIFHWNNEDKMNYVWVY